MIHLPAPNFKRALSFDEATDSEITLYKKVSYQVILNDSFDTK